MIDNLSIAVHALPMHMLTLLSINKILLYGIFRARGGGQFSLILLTFKKIIFTKTLSLMKNLEALFSS